METFSALLAICAGNSPVPGEIPTQRPVTRSFDVSFDLRLNKRLSTKSWGWWLETLSCSLWRQSKDILNTLKSMHSPCPHHRCAVASILHHYFDGHLTANISAREFEGSLQFLSGIRHDWHTCVVLTVHQVITSNELTFLWSTIQYLIPR